VDYGSLDSILLMQKRPIRRDASAASVSLNYKYVYCVQISLQSVCYEEILGSTGVKLSVEVALLLGGFPLRITVSILYAFAQGANWIRRAS